MRKTKYILLFFPCLLCSSLLAQEVPQPNLSREAGRLVDLLGSYLTQVVQYREEPELRQEYYDLALELFESGQAQIEVKSLRNPTATQTYTAEEYLQHLIELGEKYGYQKIVLSWTPAVRMEEGITSEGQYQFEVIQTFVGGPLDGAAKYSDQTTKQVSLSNEVSDLPEKIGVQKVTRILINSVRAVDIQPILTN